MHQNWERHIRYLKFFTIAMIIPISQMWKLRLRGKNYFAEGLTDREPLIGPHCSRLRLWQHWGALPLCFCLGGGCCSPHGSSLAQVAPSSQPSRAPRAPNFDFVPLQVFASPTRRTVPPGRLIINAGYL